MIFIDFGGRFYSVKATCIVVKRVVVERTVLIDHVLSETFNADCVIKYIVKICACGL